jgi:hypothetical protein
MAVTQAHIDALNQAIADGVRQVTIGGITTTYNTTESLIKARDDQQTQLNAQAQAASGRPPRPKRTKLFHAGRGYQ